MFDSEINKLIDMSFISKDQYEPGSAEGGVLGEAIDAFLQHLAKNSFTFSVTQNDLGRSVQLA